MTHLTYLEAAVVGLIQGVSEMFPVSSLGHNVLIPAIVGGSWARDLNVATPESPYLAFIVGLHVATAIALLIYFWRDWLRIIRGFFSSVVQLRAETPDQRLAWMVILATIPVGIAGVAFEHTFRVIFGQPLYAAAFLAVNGVILIAAERFRRHSSVQADRQIARQRELALAAEGPLPDGPTAGGPPAGGTLPGATLPGGPPWEAAPAGAAGPGAAVAGGCGPAPGHRAVRAAELAEAEESDLRLARQGYLPAFLIGSAQILALLAGISRDGVAMVAGMTRGLSREDAARFAFLLATPVILAAGALKIPDLLGPLGNGIRGQILLGSVLSGAGAYLSVRFLLRYLRTRTLTPFGIYCLVAGLGSLLYLGVIR